MHLINNMHVLNSM